MGDGHEYNLLCVRKVNSLELLVFTGIKQHDKYLSMYMYDIVKHDCLL